jgi:triacylglycerol lipase
MKTQIIIGEKATTGQRAIGDGIAMQLASITYCSTGTNTVAKTLAHYLPDWQLVWEPLKTIKGNYAFIAFNGIQYVVAIRGSVLSFSFDTFYNWVEQDFNIFFQQDWPYTHVAHGNPKVSDGAMDGLNNLVALTDKNGQTMLDFLLNNAIPNNNLLCVTGHSLGGNLATVFAPWLLYKIQQAGQPVPPIFSVLSFAAPTSWNVDFADQFNAAFTNSWRYINPFDIIPYAACDVEGLGLLYPSLSANNIFTVVDGVTITLAEAFIGLQLLIAASEVANGRSFYKMVNTKRGTVMLNTGKQLFPVNQRDPLLEQWFQQAGQQHDHNHYLAWLGENPVDCQKTNHH